jgi:ATP-dependent DNA helicase RecG
MLPFEYHGKRVVLFDVRPAFDRPVKFYGTAYVRDGSAKTELSRYPEKERQIWQERKIRVVSQPRTNRL